MTDLDTQLLLHFLELGGLDGIGIMLLVNIALQYVMVGNWRERFWLSLGIHEKTKEEARAPCLQGCRATPAHRTAPPGPATAQTSTPLDLRLLLLLRWVRHYY